MAVVNMKIMPVIYVAGPFRGKTPNNFWQIHQNIYDAAQIGLKIWEMGGAVIVPHLNTSPYQNALPDNVWLEGDLCILDRCDAIFMLPTWKSSLGATEERNYAIAAGIPVFDDLGKIKEFIDGYRADTNNRQKSNNGDEKRGLWRRFRGFFKNGVPIPYFG